ncbi:formylmethanofuran dehydrogenase subunit C [uncultured Lamprocystis sp.]|jgi:formylmethanofuran dehydrogenase subunit C|uniref:formylmethanofuran dehydrogenase subunit C n=1 Tax=uncultured Lamprocystis sp. TaxID=543132 RepID=UPI0025F8990C|nr:formylmethanofuran dehydrogenase subunit C [uncultured Lamprocystis sp.]
MTALTLQLLAPPSPRIDLSAFTPDGLAGQSADEVRRLPLWVGNQQVETGDLFRVTGDDTDAILIRSDSDRLDGIGTGMTRGSIRVEGRAGAYLGRRQRGGAIAVTGDAGPFAGSGMSGGTIRIGGDAGDFLGAAIAGERRGMRGGRIEVLGNAGDRVGDHQRRGQILINGNAGDYCGSRMVAGTILVLGRTGINTGLAMRRGTLLLTAEPNLPPTFNDNGTQQLAFLALLTRDLATAGGPFEQLKSRGTRVRRWLGDLGYGGQGEVLVWG